MHWCAPSKFTSCSQNCGPLVRPGHLWPPRTSNRRFPAEDRVYSLATSFAVNIPHLRNQKQKYVQRDDDDDDDDDDVDYDDDNDKEVKMVGDGNSSLHFNHELDPGMSRCYCDVFVTYAYPRNLDMGLDGLIYKQLRDVPSYSGSGGSPCSDLSLHVNTRAYLDP
ncbi:hypothetical protein PoB_002624600 [Plakobranchus ocellatus]|uniref:Uncharacterized protein n=1 Tax=Plakobranchus ocellatus TaxID=259542 RepID=A0AAV3ZKU7_9GAST|nr:hypothetical protein PoB_002624600 [Plakobranchus ocellatus]